MTTDNDTAMMTEEQLREGLAKVLYGCFRKRLHDSLPWQRLDKEYKDEYREDADEAIAYLRTHSPEAAGVERLKADNAQWADAVVDADAEHDRLSAEVSRLTRELADVSISRDEWQQLAADLKLLVEAQTDLQALEAEFGESHGQ